MRRHRRNHSERRVLVTRNRASYVIGSPITSGKGVWVPALKHLFLLVRELGAWISRFSCFCEGSAESGQLRQ
jgi:hypothetical protein